MPLYRQVNVSSNASPSSGPLLWQNSNHSKINIHLLTTELAYNEMWEIQVVKKKKKKKMKGYRSRNLMSVVPVPLCVNVAYTEK